MTEFIASDGGSLVPIDGIQAGPLLDSMKIVMKGDGGGTGEPQSLADFLKDRDPNEPLPGDLEFVTDAGHLLIPASQATPGFIADVQHLLSHYRHLPAREQKVALDRVLAFHFTMTPAGEKQFVGEAKGEGVDTVTDQELGADLQSILTGPASEDKSALETIFHEGGLSQDDVRLITHEGRVPRNPNAKSFYHYHDWNKTLTQAQFEEITKGLDKRIQELQHEKEKLDREIQDLREKGADEKKIQEKEKVRGRVEKALKDKEAARRDLEKRLEDTEKSGDEKPIPFSLDAKRVPEDFFDYFPYTVPVAVVLAVLAYLLSRPKLNPVRVPKHPH